MNGARDCNTKTYENGHLQYFNNVYEDFSVSLDRGVAKIVV